MLFVSGAIALVYEVVWQRQFALVFGSGAPATAAVLAAYFAGLGAGAFCVGRWAQRWSRPLRAYALLEVLVGAGAVAVGPLLAWFEAGYPALYRALSSSPAWFLAARLGIAFVALLVPTFCMGGTLPLLGAWVDRNRRQLGVTAGRLYVVNTLGAAVGALAVPFFFLPRLGLAQTVWLCAGANMLLGGAAWWLDRRAGPVPASDASEQSALSSAGPATRGENRAVWGLALVSGVVTFALQVLWNRAFAQVHENSMYSFAVIVAVVIGALAVGGQLARIGLRRGIEVRRLLGAAWLLAGVGIVAGPWLFLRWSGGLDYLSEAGGGLGHLPRLLALAVPCVGVPMALLGVGVPAIMERAGRGAGPAVARALGRLLAVNVAGSVTGALLAGFALPYALGLWNGMLWLGALVLAAGAAANKRLGAGLLAAWVLSAWPIAQLDLPRVRLAPDQTERLLALSEGTHGITAVTERRESRRLKLNNHYALGGTAATGDERMQAHIPLLLHPAPRRVAFLGLGTGITAGGALFHPVESVTAMELVPEVVAAARAHFRAANAGLLDDPRTIVVADDARHALRSAAARYDVVVGDLVVPWRQGEGALFTQEQFAAARAALAPGGVFCQWLPLFQLSETDLNIVLRTFLGVFPRAQVWRGDFSPHEPALALIGAAGAMTLNPEDVARRVAEMRRDETNPQLTLPDVVWLNFIGVLEPGDLPASETRVNSENRPWIEFLGPRERGRGGHGRFFTGRPLQQWMENVSRRSAERLGPGAERIAKSMTAGGALAEMTLCLQEGDRRGMAAAQARLKTMLPEATYRSLFP